MSIDKLFSAASSLSELVLILQRDFPKPDYTWTLGQCACGQMRCCIIAIDNRPEAPRVLELTAQGFVERRFAEWEVDEHADILEAAIQKAIGAAMAKQR